MKTIRRSNWLAALAILAGSALIAGNASATNESDCIILDQNVVVENNQENFFLENVSRCDGASVIADILFKGSSGTFERVFGAQRSARSRRSSNLTDNGNTVVPVAGGAVVRSQSAGDGFGYPFGVWASYSHNSFESEFAVTASDADSDSIFIGADFTPYDGYVFGVALGYDKTDVDTTFNTGEVELDSLSVIPYMAISLSEHLGTNFDLSMDSAIGYSNVDISQFRTAAGARVTSSTRADRWFFSNNLNAGQYFGDLYLSGRAGILVSRNTTDGFQESNGTVVPENKVSFGRATVGGEAAYGIGSFEPFVNAYFQHDFQLDKSPIVGAANDKNDVRVGLGVRMFVGSTWSGGVEYNRTLGRDQFDEDAINFTIRGDF